jgi:NADH:ubiquinone oxidoreductase subunit 6 (subunit J)
MEQKISTPVQKGLIISLILIVFGLALYFTNQYMNKGLSYLQYLILIIGIIWSCNVYAKQMNGNVTFGNVFAHGFKTTAFVAALMAVYTFVAVKFLFPEMVDKIMDATREEMQKNDQLNEEQISQSLEMIRKFFLPFAIGGIIFFFALVGAISSLIGAAIAKKNPKDPFAQPQM